MHTFRAVKQKIDEEKKNNSYSREPIKKFWTNKTKKSVYIAICYKNLKCSTSTFYNVMPTYED